LIFHSADLKKSVEMGNQINIIKKIYNMKFQTKITPYILVAILVVIGIYFFPIPGKTGLGSAVDSQGTYTLKTTTSGESVICAVPCVLHRIVFGTANDTLKIINSPTANSGNTAMTITATVPGTYNFETTFNTGLTTYVTSSTGVLFVTSPK